MKGRVPFWNGNEGQCSLHSCFLYANLQAGRYDEAKRLLDELEGMKAALPRGDFKVSYAAAAMPARYAVEQREWEEAAALAQREEDLPQALAVTHWARAVGMVRGGRSAGAAQEIEKLQECLEKLRGAKDGYWAAQVEIQIDEAKAWAPAAAGRRDEALALAHSAADRQVHWKNVRSLLGRSCQHGNSLENYC